MVYLVWALTLIFGGALTAVGSVPWWIGLIISSLGISLTLPWVLFIPARTGATILNNFTGELRSVGPGACFIWRPLERLDRLGEIRVFNHEFLMNAEAKNKDVAPLKIHLEYETVPSLLHRWFIVGEEKAVNALFERRAKAKITERVYDFDNRELVYDCVDQLSGRIRRDLEEMAADEMPFPAYCGVKVNDFRISDVDLPQAIADAEVRKEVAEEDRKAKAIEWQAVEDRANAMIAKGLAPEKAIERIQVQDGKVKDQINRIDIGRNLAELGRDLGTGIGNGISGLGAFLGAKPKPPAAPRTPRPRQKPPFKAVVEINDEKLAKDLVRGGKKIELEVKRGR